MQEECDNFARIGLRTLIIGVRELSKEDLQMFKAKYELIVLLSKYNI